MSKKISAESQFVPRYFLWFNDQNYLFHMPKIVQYYEK